MLHETFDPHGEEITRPNKDDYRVHADVCVITYSDVMFNHAVFKYGADAIGELKFCCGNVPVMICKHEGADIAFYKSYIGAPIAVGSIGDASEIIDAEKFVAFGSAGSLDASLEYGQLVVPTAAYRDEGTSYHYAAPADYIDMKNAGMVSDFLHSRGKEPAMGNVWTTDAFWRETRGKAAARRSEGCVCVEMECSALQAACDFRGYELYQFLYAADLLDAPEWDRRTDARAGAGLPFKHEMIELAFDLAAHVSAHENVASARCP